MINNGKMFDWVETMFMLAVLVILLFIVVPQIIDFGGVTGQVQTIFLDIWEAIREWEEPDLRMVTFSSIHAIIFGSQNFFYILFGGCAVFFIIKGLTI